MSLLVFDGGDDCPSSSPLVADDDDEVDDDEVDDDEVSQFRRITSHRRNPVFTNSPFGDDDDDDGNDDGGGQFVSSSLAAFMVVDSVFATWVG